MTRYILLNEKILVYLFCISCLLGPAVSELFSFDKNRELRGYTDTKTYLGLASGELQQSPKRRYRVLIPLMAAGVNTGKAVWVKLTPRAFRSDFTLPFSFFVVNLALMGVFGLLIYLYLRSYGLGIGYSLFGLLTMLTCRYSFFSAGAPMVESLYFIVIALTLLGIRTKNTAMLVTAIFLGPFAKELFVFVAPLIFFFGHIPKRKQLLLFLLSGGVVMGFRYLFDRYAGLAPAEGVTSDIEHMKGVVGGIKNLFSFGGIYEIFTVTGLWILGVVAALRYDAGRKYLRSLFTPLHVGLLVSVFLQIILSGAVARMFYLCMPLLCLMVAGSISMLNRNHVPVIKEWK